VLSARRSLSLFLAAVICLAFWQVWLTWHLMEQDRGLERQRSREHLAQTADLAVAEVSRNLGNWQLILRGVESLPPPPSVQARVPTGSTFVLISISDVATYPQKALLFLPDVWRRLLPEWMGLTLPTNSSFANSIMAMSLPN
jgi:hypothetical protein